MNFEAVNHTDLIELLELQPEGWPDIIPDMTFYLNSSFCHPIKAILDGKIIGIGTFIIFENTSWLAHIIVHKNYRKKGFGFQIVKKLLRILEKYQVDTCSLIATELGQPIYEKAGFAKVSNYLFLKRVTPWNHLFTSTHIRPFLEGHRSMIYDLDKRTTGENREKLLSGFLQNAMVYIENEKVIGYYLPGLKEGLIFAETCEAGIALMNLKYSSVDKAVIPSENLAGIDFLKQIGFTDTGMRGTRMVLGKGIDWKPTNIYSRIGGNFG